MRKLYVPALLLGAVLVGVLAPARALAAETKASGNFNVTVSPVSLNAVTRPGVPTTTQMWVQNNAAQPINLRLTLMKFQAHGTTGEAEIVSPTKTDPSVAWVKFSKTTFTAQPNQLNPITITFRPDKTASFGYYYAVVVTKDEAAQQVTGRQAAFTGSAAVLMLANAQVPGEKRQLEVASFKPKHKLFEFLPASFEVSVKNSGNIHAIPMGDVIISRDKKTDLASLPINPAEGNVLPQSSRNFNVEWTDGFPAREVKRIGGQVANGSDGKPQTKLNWDISKLDKFRFGKYYAHMYFVYNDGQKDVPIESTVSFWVFPWKIAIVALLILALVLFGVFTILRKTFRVGSKLTKRRPKVR